MIHLAGQSIVGIANPNPVSTFESNIRGPRNVLEPCRRPQAARWIVIASSDKVYGEQDDLRYSDDTPLEDGHR